MADIEFTPIVWVDKETQPGPPYLNAQTLNAREQKLVQLVAKINALLGNAGTTELALAAKADLVNGKIPDGQIPTAVARDQEITDAIGALPFRAGNVDQSGAPVGSVSGLRRGPAGYVLEPFVPGDAVAPPAAPVIRETLHDSERDNNTPTINFTTGAGTTAGDTIAVVHGADWNDSSGMLPPAGDITDWHLETTAGTGNNVPHIKVWTATAPSSGQYAISINRIANFSDSYFGAVFVFEGAVTIEGAAPATGTGPAHTAPSLTPGDANRMLLCAWQAGYSGSSAVTYTDPPPAMTPRTLDAEGTNSGGTGALLTATQVLTAPGPTGTRTATFGDSRAWAAVSLLIGPRDHLVEALGTVPNLEELEQSCTLGEISTSRTVILSVAQTTQRIGAIALAASGAIPQDASNYWTVSLVRYRSGSPATMANKLTQGNAPFGEPVAAYSAWSFDLLSWTNANRYLRKGDVLALAFTSTGSPQGWHNAQATWRYEPGVVA